MQELKDSVARLFAFIVALLIALIICVIAILLGSYFEYPEQQSYHGGYHDHRVDISDRW